MQYFNDLKYGWMTISIGDGKWPASYIDDIALNIMTAYKHYLEYEYAIIDFDAEGWSWNLVLTDYDTCVIEKRDAFVLYTYDVDPKELLEEMYKEIKENVEDFASFQCSMYEEADEYNALLKEYEEMIKEIDIIVKIKK